MDSEVGISSLRNRVQTIAIIQAVITVLSYILVGYVSVNKLMEGRNPANSSRDWVLLLPMVFLGIYFVLNMAIYYLLYSGAKEMNLKKLNGWVRLNSSSIMPVGLLVLLKPAIIYIAFAVCWVAVAIYFYYVVFKFIEELKNGQNLLA